MAGGKKSVAKKNGAVSTELTNEDLKIFAQFGDDSVPVSLRTRRRVPLPDESVNDDESSNSDSEEIIPAKRVSARRTTKTTASSTSSRYKATSSDSPTLPISKRNSTATAPASKASTVKSTASSSKKTASSSNFSTSDTQSTVAKKSKSPTLRSPVPTKLSSSADNVPSNIRAGSSPKATASASTPKKVASVSKRSSTTPPKSSATPDKTSIPTSLTNNRLSRSLPVSRSPSPRISSKKAKLSAPITPKLSPYAKSPNKVETTAVSSPKLSSAEKKRGRNLMTKLESTTMELSEPVTIVAPKVTSKLRETTSNGASKPPKKKPKVAEVKKEVSTSSKAISDQRAKQLVASQPPVSLPSALSQKDGIYDWRESDCEEARFYQYCRVWYTQPSHTEAWRNEGANQSEVRENTYGEVTPEGMLPLFEEINFESGKDVFLDIGSGLGNLVFYASFVKRALKAYGIEILLSRHNAQLEIRDDLALLSDPSWDPSTCQFVHTTHHDLNLCPGIEKMLGESTVIFCNNLLFSASSNTQVLTAIQNLAFNAKYVIFTSPPLPRDSKRNPAFLRLWRTFEAWDACSWCAKPLTYYIYRPYYALEGQSAPAPLFRYPPLPLTANYWSLDPRDSDRPIIDSNGDLAKGTNGKKKTPKSRYITEYALISVPEHERMALKSKRRNGIPADGITQKVSRTASTKGSARGAAAKPTPIYNLKGDRISFLVPYLQDSEKTYPQMIYEAFNAARICANRYNLKG